jgi:hypothetical protein
LLSRAAPSRIAWRSSPWIGRHLELALELAVEITAGLVGVFTGVFLALWADRRRTAKAAREEGARLREDLAQSRQLVISSVVKNTSEAKRLRLLGMQEPAASVTAA